ncbi:citrate transporter, partial [Bacillus cereus]|nr:citrate transporter [Bacillus cereus]
ELFIPHVTVLITSAIWVVIVFYYHGKKERNRLGVIDLQNLKQMQIMDEQAATVEAAVHKLPKLLCTNFLLSATLLVCLILEV